MKKVLLFLALMLTSSLAFAQETTTTPAPATAPEAEEPAPKFTAAVDVTTPYIWRGFRLNSDRIAFQPYAAYTVTDKLTLGVWGSTNLNDAANAYNEFDWYVSYQATPVLKLMLSDYYYNPTKKNGGSRASYFNYDETAPHVMDFTIGLNFTDKGLPIDFQWNTLVYGNDFKYDEQGHKKRAYSTYAELGYTHSVEKINLTIRPFIGAAVINEGGYYGINEDGEASGFKLTNSGINISKSFKLNGDYEIPVFIKFTHNENKLMNITSSGAFKSNFITAGMTFTIR